MRVGVPLLVMAALALPWTAMALPSLWTTTVVAPPPGRTAGDAALASMFIRPSTAAGTDTTTGTAQWAGAENATTTEAVAAAAAHPPGAGSLIGMLLAPSAAVPTVIAPHDGGSEHATASHKDRHAKPGHRAHEHRATGRIPAAGRPVRIVVPALGVDAPIRGISGNSGILLPPSDPTSIGWWREGRRAGAPHGTAVLTGHTVHTGGGAFDHLGRLRADDTVLVRTTRGWLRYAVSRTREYRKGRLAAAATRIFRQSGPGRLVLITCSQFDGHEYLANRVVYAVLLSGHLSG